MYTIARYYSTPEHMTRLFTKLTNQMIRRCKEQITDLGKVWDQDKPVLIGNMKVCGIEVLLVTSIVLCI